MSINNNSNKNSNIIIPLLQCGDDNNNNNNNNSYNNNKDSNENSIEHYFGDASKKQLLSSLSEQSVEEFLQQNFERVHLFEDQNENENVFLAFNKLMNEKIINYKLKIQNSLNSQRLSSFPNQLIIPKPVSFKFDERKVLNDLLNDDAYSQKQQGECVIDMNGYNKNEYHKYQDPLSKQQLKQIKENGSFSVQIENGQEKRWRINNSFFASKNDEDFYKLHINEQKLSSFIKVIYNKCVIRKYKTKGIINCNKYDEFNFSFLNGLLTLLYIPKNLLAMLIGEPIYQFHALNDMHQGLINSFSYKIREQNLRFPNAVENLKIISEQNYLGEDLMIQVIQQYEMGQLEIRDKNNLKQELLFCCYQRYIETIAKEIINKEERSDEQIEEFKKYFLLYLVMQPLLNKYDTDYQNYDYISQFYNSQTIKILQSEELKEQYKLAEQMLEELDMYKMQYPPSKKQFYIFNDEDIYLELNCYFWKIKYIIKFSILSIHSTVTYLSSKIIDGSFGFKVCFYSYSANNSEKTISTRFQNIKDEINARMLKEKEEDSDGLFGPCCSMCFLMIGSYVFKYFFKGILYINIFLRLICLIYISFFSFLFLFAALFIGLLALACILVSVLLYDFALPNQKIYTYPQCMPLLQIFFRFFKGIFQVMLSLFLIVFSGVFEILALIFKCTCSIPLRIKNQLSYCMIYLFAQVPERDSKYCTEDKTIFLDGEVVQYYQLTFHQIKIFIDSCFQKIPFEILIQNLKKDIDSQRLSTQSFYTSIDQNLPFSSEKSKLKNMTQMCESKFDSSLNEIMNNFENQFPKVLKNPNMEFKYSKQEFQELFSEVSKYLKEEYGQKRQYQRMWTYFNCEQGDYDLLTSLFFGMIFLDKKIVTISEIYNELVYTEIKQDEPIRKLFLINTYLEKKYNQSSDLIDRKDLQVYSLLFEFTTNCCN